MRILISFLIGLFAFFYLGELFHRAFKIRIHSLIGLLLLLLGFLTGFFGRQYVYPPLDTLLATFLLGCGFGLTSYNLLSRRYLISEQIELKFIRRHETLFERFFEILPGALTWIVLTSPFWLSFTLPFAVAYLLIIADVYWLFSSIKNALFIYLGYRKIEWVTKQPWLQKLKADFPITWENYYHLVLIPTYKESLTVLAPAFDAIASCNYPKQKIFLAIGFEEREQKQNPPKIKEAVEYLKQHSKKIVGVFTTIHPFGLQGEVPGPGSNRNWMIRNAVKELSKRNILPEQVLVTTLDADFVIHHEFLAGALHKYLSTPLQIRDKRT